MTVLVALWNTPWRLWLLAARQGGKIKSPSPLLQLYLVSVGAKQSGKSHRGVSIIEILGHMGDHDFVAG